MKRFTSLMLMLLMAVTTWAQTYYTLGERKTSFSDGDKVLIYSTCRVNGVTDYTGFYKNVANDAKITFYKPATIGTFDDSYVWTVNVIEDTENYTKVSFSRTDGKYWGIGGLTSNATVGDPQTYYITQWNKSLIKSGQKAGGDVYAEDHDGNAVSQTNITDADPYFAVQCENGKCLNTNGRQYQTGNSVAYPIVFYSVNETDDTKRPATANDITNEKKYVVAANEFNRGAWCFKADADDEKMYSTDKNGRTINRNDVNNQFAFITFNGETYLYSVGKQKFVHRNPGYTERANSYPVVSDTPTTPVSILQSTSGSNIYRYVVAFNINGSEGQIGVSNSYTTGIITDYNDLGDGGNSVEIVEAGDFTVTDEIRNAILEKQLPLFKAELAELATELEALSKKTFYSSEVLEELTSMASDAKTTAEAAASTDDVEGLYTKITAAKSLILRVKYVTNVNGFSNNAVYTIVSKYSNDSYVMYDASETTDYAISSSRYNDVEKGESVAGCQWAVYKSDNEKFYLYNIGAKKFMGKTTDANGQIPMSDKPTANDIIFKASADQDYHMMISVNNGTGALNHNNTYTHGLLNWNGGWGNTSGEGNVHKITVVGALDESTLAELETLVANYEAGAELQSYLDEIKTNYFDEWANGGNGGWRIAEGMNNYSQQEGDEDFVTAYNAAREYLNGDVTEEGVQQHKNKMAELIENLQINQPETGKYYRLRCVNGKKYMSSNVNDNGKTLMNGNVNDATSIFYYDGAFMTYVTGRYISAAQSQNGFQLPVGERKGFALYDGKINNNPGSYLVQVNSRYLYGKNDVIDQGSNQPTGGDTGYNWWLEEVTSLPVTITPAGYSTLYAPVALQVPEGVKAYTVTINGAWATLNEIEGVIPANTGVVIGGANGEAAAQGTYNFAITTSDPFTGENALAGTVAATYVEEDAYVLGIVDNVVGFYNAKKNQFDNTAWKNNSHKAYLPKPEGSEGVASYSFRFGEGTTGVEKVEIRNEKSEIYDLTGRRVENPSNGIYIINGVKVLVK